MAVFQDFSVVEAKLGPEFRVYGDFGQGNVELGAPFDDRPNNRGGFVDAVIHQSDRHRRAAGSDDRANGFDEFCCECALKRNPVALPANRLRNKGISWVYEGSHFGALGNPW